MIMSTFVESFDFSGKTLQPFVTYAVSGLGSTERDSRRHRDPVPRSAKVLRYGAKGCNQRSPRQRSGCAGSDSAPEAPGVHAPVYWQCLFNRPAEF